MSSFPISNWFSSLRRQPKNKKTKTEYAGGSGKYIQRSCMDLTANSTFYITREEDANYFPTAATGKQATPAATRITFIPSGTGNANNTTTSLTTKDNTHEPVQGRSDNDDRCNLLSGRRRRVSQLCSRCCCPILLSSRSGTPPPTTPPAPSPAFTSLVTLANAISHIAETSSSITTPPVPYDTHRTQTLAPLSGIDNPLVISTSSTPTASPTTPTAVISTTITTEKSIRTDVAQYFSTVPSPTDGDIPKMVFNKRTQFTNTRTLMITRPIEVLLNEKGEIIGRRRPHLSARSNSFGGILDEECENTDDGPQQQRPQQYGADNLQPFANSSALRISQGDEWRFIDDCSTSQSENEFVVPNMENNCVRTNPDATTSPDYNNEYCDNCKVVIQQNDVNISHVGPPPSTGKQIKDELCEVASEMEALDVPEDCKHSNKEKQMSIGRKKFNMDPKKGIEYLVENRLLRHDPQDVAHFLYKGEGLNKTAIGDYLGEKNEFNEDVLKAFVALHDFTNLILVQALRQFLWSFRLPGEAQKIDRMMECFAQRYCQLNPDIFTNTDTCYVLSFAIIMLNTSLHNPSVKDKPTVEQFISMNRGINNGGDLPRGLLESLYESIRTEPFKIPQDDGNDLMHTFFNPDKEGWLWKQGGRYKSWKRRWFILNDNCLYYFEYTTDKEPRGIIPLENISVREIHDRSKPFCFELFATGGADIIKACKTDSEGKVVEGKHTVYRMSAATGEDQQEWIKRLTQSISHNPFYDILIQRKKKALSKS